MKWLILIEVATNSVRHIPQNDNQSPHPISFIFENLLLRQKRIYYNDQNKILCLIPTLLYYIDD